MNLSQIDPVLVKKAFIIGQGIVFIFVFLAGSYIVFFKKTPPQFRTDGSKSEPEDQDETDARVGNSLPPPSRPPSKEAPPALTGISIHQKPHEILGVGENASEKEIQAAYRSLMKQYHPDKIDTLGSGQWKDAQKIASAINAAKDTLLDQLEKK